MSLKEKEKEKLKRKASDGLPLEAFKIYLDKYFSKFQHEYSKEVSFNKINFLPKQKISGVYLMYGLSENAICFTYIGQSNDIYKRWKQHRKKILTNDNANSYKTLRQRIDHTNYKNIQFKILELIDDEQEMYYRETYHLLMTKNKFLTINKKHCSKSMLCKCEVEKKHGVSKAYISIKENKIEVDFKIYCYSKNKNCKNKILIN